MRTEEGWPIVTKNTGRDDLPVGVYVLEEDRQAYVHDRKIPDPVRVAVLTRDHFRCTEMWMVQTCFALMILKNAGIASQTAT